MAEIRMDTLKGVWICGGQAVVSSWSVAHWLRLPHSVILLGISEAVKSLKESGGMIHRKGKRQRKLQIGKLFMPFSYGRRRQISERFMSADGFSLMVSKIPPGEENIKAEYCRAFRALNEVIHTWSLDCINCCELTYAINRTNGDDAVIDDYAIEMSILFRTALSQDVAQFRYDHQLDPGAPIVKAMQNWQKRRVETLQALDAGLLAAIPDPYERENVLRAYNKRLMALHEKDKNDVGIQKG